MRMEVAVFGLEAQRGESCFDALLQFPEASAGIIHAHPEDPRITHVREAADRGEANSERVRRVCDALKNPDDLSCVGLFRFPEELEGGMELLPGFPPDICAGGLQSQRNFGKPVFDLFRSLDSDKRSHSESPLDELRHTKEAKVKEFTCQAQD